MRSIRQSKIKVAGRRGGKWGIKEKLKNTGRKGKNMMRRRKEGRERKRKEGEWKGIKKGILNEEGEARSTEGRRAKVENEDDERNKSKLK